MGKEVDRRQFIFFIVVLLAIAFFFSGVQPNIGGAYTVERTVEGGAVKFDRVHPEQARVTEPKPISERSSGYQGVKRLHRGSSTTDNRNIEQLPELDPIRVEGCYCGNTVFMNPQPQEDVIGVESEDTCPTASPINCEQGFFVQRDADNNPFDNPYKTYACSQTFYYPSGRHETVTHECEWGVV